MDGAGLDKRAADAAYDGRIRYRRDGADHGPPIGAAPAPSSTPPPTPPDDDDELSEVVAEQRALWDARKARSQALEAERAYAVAMGSLIPEADVTKRYTDLLRLVKRRMLGLPARVAGRLAGLDARALEAALDEAVSAELVGAAEELDAMAVEAEGVTP